MRPIKFGRSSVPAHSTFPTFSPKCYRKRCSTWHLAASVSLETTTSPNRLNISSHALWKIGSSHLNPRPGNCFTPSRAVLGTSMISPHQTNENVTDTRQLSPSQTQDGFSRTHIPHHKFWPCGCPKELASSPAAILKEVQDLPTIVARPWPVR